MLRVSDTWRYNIKKTWEAETMMNETIKTLLERRSIRGYKKDLVLLKFWIRFWKRENMHPAEWECREP